MEQILGQTDPSTEANVTTTPTLKLRCPCCGAVADENHDIVVSEPVAVGGSVYQEAWCKWCGEIAPLEDFTETVKLETR